MPDIGAIPSPARLAGEAAIRAVLAQYCRAVDRCDAELLARCFGEGAVVDYGGYCGLAQPFCPALIDAIKAWGQTHHQIGQTIIEFIDDDLAHAETYVTASHFPGEGQGEEMTYLGRYIDRFERRGDSWSIANRVIVMSWTRHAAVSHDPCAGAVWQLRVAARKPDDAIYG